MRYNGSVRLTGGLAGIISPALRITVGLSGLNGGLGGLAMLPRMFFARLQSSREIVPRIRVVSFSGKKQAHGLFSPSSPQKYADMKFVNMQEVAKVRGFRAIR